MNDIKSEVLIEREGRVVRWGQAAYFKTWNGFKETFSLSAVKAVATPIAVVIAMTAFISNRRELNDGRGRELRVPSITQDVPLTSIPIVNDVRLTNQIPSTGLRRSIADRIRVYNLRETSDIPVGSESRAIFESGATNGIVKARLLKPLIVDGEAILPERTTIFGRGKSTEERLYVEFQKAILPNGESFPIRAQAFDVGDKILGLKGTSVGNRTRKMATAIGFGVFGGLADSLKETSGTSIWGQEQKKSLKDAALAGASKAALDQSTSAIEEMKNAPFIIEVKAGTEFFMMIDEPKQQEK